jgi:hypothetical protein
MNWFECKVKYEKTIEDGNIVNISESYLVDALSFTEAEGRIIEEMKPFISGEFQVANIKRVKISEMFFNPNTDKEDNRWYKSKVNYITFDEESKTEKRTAQTMYVQAADIKSALVALETGLSSSMADNEIVNIAETLVIEVYKYETAQ